LVQGVEARHTAAANVLSWFRFIPDARLDDLMISIAGVGGGVGPHVDSYDVFLIQMEGRRRWKISAQSDLSLRDDLPLKILSRFKAKEDWVLEPGDLLYLPPHIAHEGVALDAGCQTWSVGFRSPSYRELLQEGLWRLAESLEDDPSLSARYADPLQGASKDPAVLPRLLEEQITKHLRKLALDQGKQWLPGIGAYLSEPKPNAIFEGPPVMMTPKAFWQSLHSKALVPHPQTRLLIWGNEVFCNGEAVSRQEPPFVQKAWLELARVHSLCLGAKNSRRNKFLVSPSPEKWIPQASSLYEAYCSGWLIWA
jgi:50S ribosomal protein L16 3-hydroxylase